MKTVEEEFLENEGLKEFTEEKEAKGFKLKSIKIRSIKDVILIILILATIIVGLRTYYMVSHYRLASPRFSHYTQEELDQLPYEYTKMSGKKYVVASSPILKTNTVLVFVEGSLLFATAVVAIKTKKLKKISIKDALKISAVLTALGVYAIWVWV